LIRHLFITLVTLLIYVISNAQSPPDSTVSHRTPFLIISGAADIYFRCDLPGMGNNDFTSFTHVKNQLRLGMVNLRMEHKTTHFDMVADLAAGPRQWEYAYTDTGILRFIKQLYLSYAPTSWLKFTAGSWATHLCYESPDAFANRNYGMSWLFCNDPFSHTGIKADIVSGNHGFMIGIAHPCDYTSIPAAGYNNKNIIAQYSYSTGDKLRLYLNYVGGHDIHDDRSHQYDLVLTSKLSSLFSLGCNATINSSSLADEKYSISRRWWGSALYLNLDPLSWLGLTLRTEYFNDKQGVKLPAPTDVMAATFSVNLKSHGFTIIPELRIDKAGAPIFSRGDGSPAYSAGSFLLAAVYSF